MTAWRVFPDATKLVGQLAPALAEAAARAIAKRGVFHLVLAGGTTPLALYRALAARAAGDSRWQVWYGDERCLPAAHPQRNSGMIEAAWLAGSYIPLSNRRPIPVELGADIAAHHYAAWLSGVDRFDVVLLGIGEDGHTASLFPGHDWGASADAPAVIAVHDAPKHPAERVSLSARRLAQSRRVWFIVTGAAKRDALARWRAGENLPVAAVAGEEETVAWLDAAAQG